MNKEFRFTIFNSAAALPPEWDSIALANVFLSREYLSILEHSAPLNMTAHFIGLFFNGLLRGVAVAQFINLDGIDTFVDGKTEKTIKNYLLNRYTSKIIVVGNNTLTGQNAYVLSDAMPEVQALRLLGQSLVELERLYRQNGIRINLMAIKDFNTTELPDFKSAGFKGYYKFCTQPNMIFTIREKWLCTEDYLAHMNAKYRTQYNRARKKAEGIEKRKLGQREILDLQDRIHELYLTVAGNASFNTFYLPKNHFYVFKKLLQEKFLFYGYFIDNKLIGFNTLIKNGEDMDTYFLGYDDAIQKEKMLYLNMLYDMVAYAVKKKFRHVVFARSAMEIKSSIGAGAEDVYGMIKHTNPILNLFMEKLFNYFDPKIQWKERNPFK